MFKKIEQPIFKFVSRPYKFFGVVKELVMFNLFVTVIFFLMMNFFWEKPHIMYVLILAALSHAYLYFLSQKDPDVFAVFWVRFFFDKRQFRTKRNIRYAPF
ncbi:MAG: VirB3 family type IV secretion system protein [Candidatus Levybacteria bacterium]|nr:VirB3 family type IV secretion system protein [Candidatus Levybacteria bacterium]